MVYNKDYDLEIGKSIELINGNDVTIFCSGTMVYNSIEASKKLKKKELMQK